ncbi:MAG TPA: alkaline phosphatase family protein [Myxococcota bacterium]|nr:alkaline phosphatase family protein [Myxococcota bacterium]
MKRAALAGVALCLGLAVGLISVRPSREEASELRCEQLIAEGDTPACTALLDPLASDPDTWTPAPALAELLIRARIDAGRSEDAAALARAAGRAHPDDPDLFRVELDARAAVEPEEDVLRDLARRIPERGAAAALERVALAQRHLQRGDARAALQALGADLPPGAESARSLWFDTLGIAHAMNDDLPAARAAYQHWQSEGGRPEEVRARYALAKSISNLRDPDVDALTSLRGALGDAAVLGDRKLEEALAIRLIFTLVNAGRADEAVATYDSLHEHLPLAGVRRDELLRARQGGELAGEPPAARAGHLRFQLAADAPEGTLFVSRGADAAPDADYQAFPIARGAPVSVERAAALAPQRWVLRARDGRTAASGTASVRGGETREIEIHPAAAGVPEPVAASLARAPGDGRRRVALVLLDCGDWAIAQYLRTRGDLPVFDALVRSGYRAVLESDPPLTAAALESLVWPGRRTAASIAGTFYRFGVELAGLESIGQNPLEALAWVLPETRDLFAAVGAGDRSAVNLLLAHGGIRAGRHGEITGPHGATRALALGRTQRPLDAGERARFPDLARARDPIDVHYAETIAAEFDATDRVLRDGEVDLVAVRIEPLDILTHAHFPEAVRDGQDDGAGLLFDVYRYADARIGALHAFLDADDVLLLMSDHGIRTAMEHDRPALFVATGAGVPAGRAPGHPSLRGVSRVIADLLGVDTAWPDTGIAAWASRAVASR